MTIQRLRVSGAESGNTSEFEIPMGNITENVPVASGTKVNTGNFAWYANGNAGGFGFGFEMQPALRMGLFINHLGVSAVGGGVLLFAWVVPGPKAYNTYVKWVNAGTMELYVDQVLVDSTTDVAAGLDTQDTFIPISMQVQGGAGGFASMYVGDERVLTYNGTVPAEFGACFVGMKNSINLSWDSTGAYMDDMYLDSTVGESDGPAVKKYFLPSFPNGVGSNVAWNRDPVSPSNWQAVDEAPDDGDTTHTYTNVNNRRDSFPFNTVTVPTGKKIVAVNSCVLAKRLDVTAGANRIRTWGWDGLSFHPSPTPQDPGMDYKYLVNRWEKQADGSDWDEFDLNNYEWGYESVI